jgi:hypothetical protein
MNDYAREKKLDHDRAVHEWGHEYTNWDGGVRVFVGGRGWRAERVCAGGVGGRKGIVGRRGFESLRL